MESVKSVMSDKSVKNKAERDRSVICHSHTLASSVLSLVAHCSLLSSLTLDSHGRSTSVDSLLLSCLTCTMSRIFKERII